MQKYYGNKIDDLKMNLKYIEMILNLKSN